MNFITNRKYFRLFYIFHVFLNTLSLGYFGISRNPLAVVVFIWGILILGYDLYKKQLFFKNSHLGIISLYGVILALATYLNKEYSNVDSYLILGMQILIFLLMFGNKKDTSLTSIKDELRSIIPFASGLTLAASGISLVMFFLNISSVRNGLPIGLVGSRLFGIYFNCNPAAFLASMMMFFSMVAIKNKYRFPLFYYVNFGVQLLYIVLSGCRTALIIVAFLFIAILYYKMFRENGFSRLKQVFVSGIVCVVILFGSSIVQKALYIIPQLQGAQEETTSRFQVDKIFEILALVQEGKSSNIHRIYDLTNEVSSGRVELLNTAYKVFKYNPIQGVGVNNFQRMGQVLNPEDNVVKQVQVVHTHNVFVETAVVGGLFGFLLFFLFFLRSSATIWSVLKKYTGTSSYFIILSFFLIVLSDFLGGFFDYGVFYVYSLSSTLSWLFLGYLYWLNDHNTVVLTSHSKYYDFMYYNLSEIDYQRDANAQLEDVSIEIVDSLLAKDVYVVRIKVALQFSQKQSQFIYDCFFKVFTEEVDVLRKSENVMAMELYEMIKEEIATLVSDGNGMMELPKKNRLSIQ